MSIRSSIQAYKKPINGKRPGRPIRTALLLAAVFVGLLVSQTYFAAAVGQWATWPSPFGATDEIRGLSRILSSPADGWAVGGDPAVAGSGKAARWDGINWALTTLPAGTNTLNGVFRLSSSDAWAVGDSSGGGAPSFVHWTGVAWNPVSLPSTMNGIDFLGVSFNAVNHGWAVGESGKIAFWNGAFWSLDASAVPLVIYRAVVIFTNDGWIVGDSATILRYNGFSWSSYTNPCQGNLQSMAAVTQTDIWVVGDTPSLCHWDGSAWTDKTGDLPSGIAPLRSIYAVDEIDLWAVGDNVGADSKPAIVNYDGQFWRKFAPADIDAIDTANLLAVSMFNGRDGFAVGTKGTAGVAKIVRFSGPVLATLVSAVTVSSTTTSTSTITSFSQWTTTTTTTTESRVFTSTRTITSTSTVTSTSTSFIFTSTSPTTVSVASTKTETVSTTSTSVIVSTILSTTTSTLFQTVSVIGQISRGDGWSFLAFASLFGISLSGVRRLPIPSLGKLRQLRRYAPVLPLALLFLVLSSQPTTAATVGSWFSFPSPTSVTLNGISDAAASPSEIWAVGASGTILRYDGVGWGPVASGVAVALRSVWRVAANDAWAVGDIGSTVGVPTILRWNGATWSLTDPADGQLWVDTTTADRCGSGQNCGNLHAIMMASATDGWAIGEPTVAGPPTILRFQSGKWRQDPVAMADADVIALAGLTLRGIHVLSTGELWAVGQPLGLVPTVLRRDPAGVGALIWTKESDTAGTGYQSPELDNAVFFDIVVIGASKDRWAVGENGGGDPIIARFFTSVPNWRREFTDNTNPPQVARLFGVSGVGVNDVWAVGERRTAVPGNDPLLVHREITGWTIISPPSVAADMNAVSMVNANDGWAVGTGGNILRFGGPLTTVTKTKFTTITALTTSVTLTTTTSTHTSTSTAFSTTVSTESLTTKPETKTETSSTTVSTNLVSTFSHVSTTTSKVTQTSTGTSSTTVVSVIVIFTSGITSILITQLPPIPGFPWESILAGLILGLLSLLLIRRRRVPRANG